LYILNGLAVLSVVLCLATAVLWVRSQRIHDMWAWSNSGYVQLHSVESEVELYWGIANPGDRPLRGSVSFIWEGLHEFWSGIHRPVTQFPAYAVDPSMTVHWDFWGFRCAEDDPQKVNRGTLYHRLAIPYWSILAVEGCVALACTGAVRRLRRARRLESVGLCRKCAYDLRATPDRCPECGTIPRKVRA
jgi:hypothetical protein